MKIKLRVLMFALLGMVCFSQAQNAMGQTNVGGLGLKAEARLLLSTNDSRIFLTLHLVNTTNHSVTVLTKHLNVETDLKVERLNIELGYGDSGVTHDGHPIIPSLYDFSPVTLEPNEEALVSQEVEIRNSGNLNKDTKFAVRYKISPDWGKRFSVWSGSIQTEPFTPTIRTPH